MNDLKKYLEEHFFYEAEMLHYGFNQCAALEKSTDKKAERNAAIELFLIHLRALIEFFDVSNKNYEDDARAAEFIQDWMASIEWQNLQKMRVRINKELAHLTWSRKDGTNPGQKNWEYVKMFANMKFIVKKFLESLPEKLKSDKLRALFTETAGLKSPNRVYANDDDIRGVTNSTGF